MNSPADPLPSPASAQSAAQAPTHTHAHGRANTPAEFFQDAQFVAFFRQVAPYIHRYRNTTFVIGFGGELVADDRLNALVQDLSLLNALGVKIVVCHGSRPQVNEQLKLKGIEYEFGRGIQVTSKAALECAKEAAGEIRLDVEALFSQGLPNTPMDGARVRVVSGNFITARPLGVLNGTDYQHTGVVRRVDADAIRNALSANSAVLISPLGFSPTGEAFNLAMEDVATATAIALNADKLIFLTETPALLDADEQLITALEYDDAVKLLNSGTLPEVEAFYMRHIIKACQGGVERSHVVPFAQDGGVLLEVFTHDGIGTMVTEEVLESIREATIDDVGAILTLIEPLEADGTLVPRGRDKIERDIEAFSVLEHDGRIFGCAALYTFPGTDMAEMACLCVSAESQGMGDGDRILKHIEQRAKSIGIKRLFVLTTRTMHWFIKRGFVQSSVDDLPTDKQRIYNRNRNSQVLIKAL
jgi:amino-acid N-acetyltransferase